MGLSRENGIAMDMYGQTGLECSVMMLTVNEEDFGFIRVQFHHLNSSVFKTGCISFAHSWCLIFLALDRMELGWVVHNKQKSGLKA